MTKEKTIKIPEHIMVGLCSIMSGVSRSFSGSEVYPEAIPGMEEAYKFIIRYSANNNIELRGIEEHNKNNQ